MAPDIEDEDNPFIFIHQKILIITTQKLRIALITKQIWRIRPTFRFIYATTLYQRTASIQAHEDEVFRLDEGRWEEIFYDDEMEDAG